MIVVAPVPPDSEVVIVKVPLPFFVNAKFPFNWEIIKLLSTVVVVSAFSVAVPNVSAPFFVVSPMVTVPPLLKTKLFDNVLAVVLLEDTFEPLLKVRLPEPNALLLPISKVPAETVVPLL